MSAGPHKKAQANATCNTDGKAKQDEKEKPVYLNQFILGYVTNGSFQVQYARGDQTYLVVVTVCADVIQRLHFAGVDIKIAVFSILANNHTRVHFGLSNACECEHGE